MRRKELRIVQVFALHLKSQAPQFRRAGIFWCILAPFREVHPETGEDHMRISKLIFVCMCLVGITQLVWSQNQHVGAGRQGHGIPGYLDPRTGTFTTRAQPSETGEETPPTFTTILARLVFNFTIAHNDQPTNATTSCTVSLSTADSSGLDYNESATAIATNNGTACTVTVLFSWTLASPTEDQVFVDYHIASFQSITVGTTASVQEFRGADHSLPSISVPLNGQTITEPTITTAI
jgi:hypothetical protein